VRQARDTGDFTLVASSLCQLAEVYNVLENFQDSLKASNEARDLYRAHGSPHDVANALHWAADTYIREEKYKEARDIVQEIQNLGRAEQDEGLEALAQEILVRMATPGAPQPQTSSTAEEDAPAPPAPLSKLVKNQQGHVMDFRTGLTFQPEPMRAVHIAEVAAGILADYAREGFDTEVPVMLAGTTSPFNVEMQSEWFRKYMMKPGPNTRP